MKLYLVLVLILLVLIISGCTTGEDAQATNLCIQLCQAVKQNGTDLSAGPCLSNAIIPGWVCDVAHSPRAYIDNIPENQCPAYGMTAKHFVEVDPECNFIRAV
ncbi:MAG: hypothetical protein QXP39_01885 [Candidatus Aenigmatarchaeota archaeon]